MKIKITKVQKKYILRTILILVAMPLLLLLSIYLGLFGRLPNTGTLGELTYKRASEVYTADSVLIGKFYLEDRQPIPRSEMPQELLDALVSIEDERFFEHSGVDLKSLFRVGIKTILLQDESSGGGSTITQQLAKNLYPRNTRSGNIIVHKIQEMIIAKRLEKVYDKEDILVRYLNTVPFGGNSFGIESATRRFFNKKTQELCVEEAALLVGMLKATYTYNPRLHPQRSTERRDLVLETMVHNNYLPPTALDSLQAIPLLLDYHKYDQNQGLAPYFREQLRQHMLQWSRSEKEKGHNYNIYTDGLKIYSSLDYGMQKQAEASMRQHMAKLQDAFEKSYGNEAPWMKGSPFFNKSLKKTTAYKKFAAMDLDEEQIMDSLAVPRNMEWFGWSGDTLTTASTLDSLGHYLKFLNTGSMALDPKTGAVKVWIGGIDFRHFKYDHVRQSQRQVGSTFKPIVYTTALEEGIDPCTYFSAREITYKNLKGWSPSNSGNAVEDYLNYAMGEALAKSVNTVAVKVLEKAGISQTLNMAKKMGITAELPEVPSLALGTAEIKVIEMATAFSSYLNDGNPTQPVLIQTIANNKDSLLYAHEAPEPAGAAFSPTTQQTMLEFMRGTVDRGTASRLRSTYGLEGDLAGKTGTTQENKDAWFIALAPNLVHVSWVGHNDYEIGFKTTAMGQGANAALPLFALWYKALSQMKQYHAITQGTMPKPSPELRESLDCAPTKKDGFFKRIFKNPKKEKKRDFNTE